MKSTVYILALSFLLMLNNIGLAQDSYIPDISLNTIVPTYKNDLILELIFPNNSEGLKYGLAYSPIKHLSLYAGMVDRNKGDDNLRNTKGYNFTTSIGTYFLTKDLNQNNKYNSRKLLFSANVGYSRGHLLTNRGEFTSEFDYHKIFAQLGLGLKYGSWDLNIFIRGNRINFIRGFVNQGYLIPSSAVVLAEIEENDYFNTMAIKFKIGFEYRFVKAIFGAAMEWNTVDISPTFLDNGLPFLGLNFNIHKGSKLLKNRKNKT